MLLQLDELHCMICGGQDNEAQLMLCDGCDRGYHSYCVGLGNLVPYDDWYREECTYQEVERNERRRRRSSRAASGTTSGSGRAGQSEWEGVEVWSWFVFALETLCARVRVRVTLGALWELYDFLAR